VSQQLAALGPVRECRKGELIYQAGDPATHVFLLERGRAKIFHIGTNGKELLLWFCSAGDVFGLCETLSDTRRTTYVQACTPSRVVAIPRARFLDCMRGNPDLALHVTHVLASRLRHVGQRKTRVVACDVHERVLSLLAGLAERYGVRDEQGLRIALRITHQEMANMIGTTRQSVTSALNELRRRGVLDFGHQHIRIHDPTVFATTSAEAGAGTPVAQAVC
jgi:CRP/FNR family transcriptional regulator